MSRRVITFILALAAVSLLPASGRAQLPTPTYGWNLGNTLEAVPNEGSWGPAATQDLINAVASSGFNVIRIPVAWNTHADQTTLKIDPVFMARVKQVVDWCYAKNLYVIVNCHWDGGWLDNNIGDTPTASVTQRMNSLWTQIATTFAGYDDHLIFAGANEPPADTPEQVTTLVNYYQTFVNAVRATGRNNSSRWLIVQGPNTNMDKSCDPKLNFRLPTDSATGRLMVEVHHYPFQWTIMTSDAGWGKMFYFWGQRYHSATMTSRNSTWGEEDYTDAQFQEMATKFVGKGIPVIIGEWGAVKRTGYADLKGTELDRHLASRTYYHRTLTNKANALGLKPIYWDAGGTGSNTMWLYDRATAAKIDPDTISALTGGAALPPPPGGAAPAKLAQQAVAASDTTNGIVNLSTRGVAEAGENAMIAGFVITGTGTKQLRIRAVAKTLADFGLTGVLRKPLLTLYDAKQVVIATARTQDTYGALDRTSNTYPVKPQIAAAFQAVGGFGLAASASGGAPDGTNACGDTVMMVDLPPGQYTASITPDADTPQLGVDTAATSGGSGLVLCELYDADDPTTATTRLVNISTRGKIESGARQMFAGFVVRGTGARRLLIRGIGPTLRSFGLGSALTSARIQLLDHANIELQANDGWGLASWADQSRTEFGRVGAFPLADNTDDAVILARVNPGQYNVIASSPGGTSGLGMVEVYED
jgi:aryl-phospho-beta-D-glucosidase BglC (GH1 family)